MESTNYYKELSQTIVKVEQLETTNFDGYSVKVIIDFLKTSHLRFTNESIPKIEQNFLLLTKAYEENNKLKTLFNLFLKFQIELNQHIKIEEKTLFPYTETLYRASIGNSLPTLLLIHFGKYSVQDFANSHENNECYLTEIIYLLNQQMELKNHPIYNILLNQLTQLNNHIKTHAWIEDNVLVKKVIEIEQAIASFVGEVKE